jgi:hypothetical protein
LWAKLLTQYIRNTKQSLDTPTFLESNAACCGYLQNLLCSEFQNPVSENFEVLWTIFQPLLFGLIGNEIDLYFLDRRTVELGVACLAASLTVSNVAIAHVMIIITLFLFIRCINCNWVSIRWQCSVYKYTKHKHYTKKRKQ